MKKTRLARSRALCIVIIAAVRRRFRPISRAGRLTFKGEIGRRAGNERVEHKDTERRVDRLPFVIVTGGTK